MINRTTLIVTLTFVIGVTVGHLINYVPATKIQSSAVRVSIAGDSPNKASRAIETEIAAEEIDNEQSFSDTKKDVSEQIASISKTAATSVLFEQEDSIKSIKRVSAQDLINELSFVSNWSELELLDIEDLAESELEFRNAIEQNPDLVKPLLGAYEELSEDGVKELLRSMLVASGALEVEQHALSSLSVGDVESQSQWLYLLKGTGVNSSDSRETLFSIMDGMADPNLLKASLHAFSPDIVSEEEQFDVANQLEVYTSHPDENVRGAGVEALSRWAGKGNSYFIESALNDESVIVRRSAVFSSFTSGIQSESIKTELIRLLGDESQPYDLRLDIFNTLSTYQLQGNERQKFFRFSEEVKAMHSGSGNAKG